MELVHEHTRQVVVVHAARVRYLEGERGRRGDHVLVRPEHVLGIDIGRLVPVVGRLPAAALELVVQVVDGARVHNARAVAVPDGVTHALAERAEQTGALHVQVDGAGELQAEDHEEQREVDEQKPTGLAQYAHAADEADHEQQNGRAHGEQHQLAVLVLVLELEQVVQLVGI